MSVLNAIRNKIVLRVVAVVNKQQPYVAQLSAATEKTFVFAIAISYLIAPQPPLYRRCKRSILPLIEEA